MHCETVHFLFYTTYVDITRGTDEENKIPVRYTLLVFYQPL